VIGMMRGEEANDRAAGLLGAEMVREVQVQRPAAQLEVVVEESAGGGHMSPALASVVQVEQRHCQRQHRCGFQSGRSQLAWGGSVHGPGSWASVAADDRTDIPAAASGASASMAEGWTRTAGAR
jgi:hypothetical protein